MNWFRLTSNGNLDRVYLRSSAVYRCLVRYGASEQWALIKLLTIMKEKDARTLLSIWKTSEPFKNRPHPWNLGKLF